MALQEASEAYLVSLFEDTNLAAIHGTSRFALLLATNADSSFSQACYYPAQGPAACPSSPRRALLNEQLWSFLELVYKPLRFRCVFIAPLFVAVFVARCPPCISCICYP